MCKIQFWYVYIVYTFGIQKVIQDIYWIDVYSITKSLIITNVVSSFQLDIKLYGKLKNNRKSNFCFVIPQNENGVNIFFSKVTTNSLDSVVINMTFQTVHWMDVYSTMYSLFITWVLYSITLDIKLYGNEKRIVKLIYNFSAGQEEKRFNWFFLRNV